MTRNLLTLALMAGFLASAGAAGVAAQSPVAPAPEGCARHQARFAALIGQSPDAVKAALEAMPGITTVRMGGPDTAMTRDYRVDRASVLIENGVVVRITCG